MDVYDYAKEVNELRMSSLSEHKRAKIIGNRGLEFGYIFAKNIKGFIIEERLLKDSIPTFKIFTGTRIWIVPQDDCEIL